MTAAWRNHQAEDMCRKAATMCGLQLETPPSHGSGVHEKEPELKHEVSDGDFSVIHLGKASEGLILL